MLADYGIPVVPHGTAGSLAETCKLAQSIGYPVVLKTATEGILHKSDVGGVHVNIGNEAALIGRLRRHDQTSRSGRAYRSNGRRWTLNSPSESSSTEQFGPIVMVAGGGVFIEIYKDRRLCLAPVDRAAAIEMLDQLAMRPILDGARGRPAPRQGGRRRRHYGALFARDRPGRAACRAGT